MLKLPINTILQAQNQTIVPHQGEKVPHKGSKYRSNITIQRFQKRPQIEVLNDAFVLCSALLLLIEGSVFGAVGLY